MNKEFYNTFIRKTESLVKPEDITPISFLGDFNRMLPKKTQDAIMKKGSKKIPYMGFIVDPYCIFLAYKITDVKAAQKMLPPGYELTKVSLFKNEPPCYMVIFSAFTARTSAFLGMRLEIYLIARNVETQLISWIISDYETNTNSYDPKNGFCGYTAEAAVFATNPYGELLVDVQGRKNSKEFSIIADIEAGKNKELDESLWIEGNLSIDYGGNLKDPASHPFGLIFDPVLMKKALKLSKKSLKINKNNYFNDIIDFTKPESIALFPYSQHFIIEQDILRKDLLSKKDLPRLIQKFLDKTGFKVMSGMDLKKPLVRGIVISWLINMGIITFLLIKLFL